MSDEEFERHREALASQRLEKPKRLSALSARFWSEITSQQYNFDRAQIEVAYLRTLTKKDVVKFFTVSTSITFFSLLIEYTLHLNQKCKSYVVYFQNIIK